MSNNWQAKLAQYGASDKRGFLPEQDPLLTPLNALKGWTDIAANLPKLLVANRLRQSVDSMPLVDLSSLKTETEIEHAMLALSFIGHAYIWGSAPVPQALPAVLARPWYEVAKKSGRPPVLSYASYALHNWRRIDPKAPIELGNICLSQNFLGGIDEEWFVLVHVDIEAKFGPALPAILSAQDAVINEDTKALAQNLKTIEKSLDQVYKVLLRMTENCDPYIYFNRVRPYIHGWKDHPLFPEGLLYTDVADYQGKPQRFRGETGAQSSIMPTLDAAFGIEHKNDFMKHYLLEMRDYMPMGHRKLIEDVENGPSIRKFVTEKMQHDKSLRDLYDRCIHLVELFRTKHLEYATNYVFKQHPSETNPHAVGTGGTPFLPYLQKHRDETAEHMLN